jgi:hypothetical protein
MTHKLQYGKPGKVDLKCSPGWLSGNVGTASFRLSNAVGLALR